MMVAEAALSEKQRPERYVLRASKMFASDRWSGRDYQPRFRSTADVRHYIQQLPICALVIDSSIPPRDTPCHHRQLRDLITRFPDDWQLISCHDITRNGVLFPGGIQVYQPAGFIPPAFRDIEIDMQAMLGRAIRP